MKISAQFREQGMCTSRCKIKSQEFTKNAY